MATVAMIAVSPWHAARKAPLFGHARKRIGMQLCKALEMEKRMHGKIRVVSIRQQPTERDVGAWRATCPASVPLPWTCGRHRVRLLLCFFILFYNKGLLIVERRLNGRGPRMGKPPLFYRACPADLANSDQNMTASITAQCHALTN